MGLKRLIKKVSFGGGSLIHGHICDAIEKKNRTGKAFKECLKESIKETFSEDLPGASHLYQMGKTEGKVEGTVEQAARDEKKCKIYMTNMNLIEKNGMKLTIKKMN